MRSNYRAGRKGPSRSSARERRNGGRGFNTNYDVEDYTFYDNREYDDEGSFRGGYEGEDDMYFEDEPRRFYDDDYDDYSIVGPGGYERRYVSEEEEAPPRVRRRRRRAARAGWYNDERPDDRTYRSTAGRGQSSNWRGHARMTRQREREIQTQGDRSTSEGRHSRGGW